MRAVFAAAVLLVAGQAHARAQTTSLRHVAVDIANQQLKATLPFDLPFVLAGLAPEAREVRVEYWDVTSELKNWERVLASWRQAQAQAPTPAPQPPWEGRAADNVLTWRPFGTPSPTDSFRVTIPALDAERYYRFRFTVRRAVAPERIAGFQRGLLPELRTLIAGIPSGDLSVADAEKLRGTAVSVMRRQLATGEILTGSNLFDLNFPADSVRQEFALLASGVLQPQLQHTAAYRSYADNTAPLVQQLTSISRDEPLVRLLLAFAKDAELKRLVDAAPRGAELIMAPGFLLQRWAAGQEEAAVDLRTANDAALTQVQVRYAELLTRLRQLQQLLVTALAPVGPNVARVNALVQAQDISNDDVLRGRRLAADNGLLQSAADLAELASSQMPMMQAARAAREKGLTDLVAAVALLSQQVAVIDASSTGDFDTFHTFYVSADAGFAYGFSLEMVMPYLATNIYLRPVNKDAPLSQRGGFRRRFAFTLGLTIKSIGDSTRANLFGSQCLLVGMGYRAAQSLRIGTGVILFYAKDTSPLRTTQSLAADPYLSASFDVDVAGIPAGLAGLFR